MVGCEGWTWLSETSAEYPNHCLMFSSLGDVENYPNCVREEHEKFVIILLSLLPSGPVSCLCSEVAACENTGDNEVDVLPNIFQVNIFQATRRNSIS